MTTPAIRTISETDDVHIIEARLAYGGPFDGRDTYRTYFSARTDWGLDLHPDGVPVLFNHGFDPDFGLHPIGRTSPTSSFRADKDGLWVQMQLDKRQEYYATRVRPLLDANGLGASQGSAEHSLDIDARTGEVRRWPLHEISLTPTESNPWNTIAARTGDIIKIIDKAVRATNAEGKAVGPPEGGKDRTEIPAEDFAGPDKSYPIVDQGSVDSAAKLIGKAADPEAVKAKVIAIAKRKGLKIPEAWSEAGRSAVRQGPMWDAAQGADVLQDLFMLIACEASEPDQVAILQRAVDAVTEWLDAERNEALDDEDAPAYMSAVRAGRRNSTTDQGHLDAAHQAMHDGVDHTLAAGAACDTCAPNETPEESPEEDASRSAESVTTLRIVEPENADAVRADLLALASKTGEAAARRLMG